MAEKVARRKRNFKIVLAVVCFLILLLFTAPLPEVSSAYDCDDDVLCMYQHFTSLGIECCPMAGNLAMTGETLEECDHVWLSVKIFGMSISYDRDPIFGSVGVPYLFGNHCEGYPVTYVELLREVLSDKIRLEMKGPQ